MLPAIEPRLEREVHSRPEISGDRYHLTNRVVSYLEAVRLFREGDAWNLQPAPLRRLGVTYAYAVGEPKLAAGCVRLEPDARLDRNPFNNEPFAAPRVLYRVIDECPASAS